MNNIQGCIKEFEYIAGYRLRLLKGKFKLYYVFFPAELNFSVLCCVKNYESCKWTVVGTWWILITELGL